MYLAPRIRPIALLVVALALPARAERATPAPRATKATPGVETVLLDEEGLKKIHKFKVFPSLPITFELPAEPELPVRCGDCTVMLSGEKNPKPPPNAPNNLVYVNISFTQRLITVGFLKRQGQQTDGSELELEAMRTNITVKLPNFGFVKIDLEATANPKEATQHVQFTAPGLSAAQALVQQKVEEAVKERDELWEHKSERVRDDGIRRLFFLEHHCDTNSTRTLGEREHHADQIVLEVEEVCWFANRLFVRFQIENRQREAPMQINVVELRAYKENGEVSNLPTRGSAFAGVTSGVPVADFDKPAQGVIEIYTDPKALPHKFLLHVVEMESPGRIIDAGFER